MSFYMYVPVLVRSPSALKAAQQQQPLDDATKKQQARDERKLNPYAIPTVEQRLARRSERLKSKSIAEKFVEGTLAVPKLTRKESSMQM